MRNEIAAPSSILDIAVDMLLDKNYDDDMVMNTWMIAHLVSQDADDNAAVLPVKVTVLVDMDSDSEPILARHQVLRIAAP